MSNQKPSEDSSRRNFLSAAAVVAGAAVAAPTVANAQDEAMVVDVREKDEWDKGHITGATHMSRGTIELDIEEKVPDNDAIIICHCGGGGRSALAAESLQKMGYKNVRSMAGGFKAWKAAGLSTTK